MAACLTQVGLDGPDHRRLPREAAGSQGAGAGGEGGPLWEERPRRELGNRPLPAYALSKCEAAMPSGEPPERRVGPVCPARLWRVRAGGTPGLGQPLS